MIILYDLVDFTEVIRIKMFALYILYKFGKELGFVCIRLGDFVTMAQCWIIELTLWLEKVPDFALRLAWIGL